MPKIQHENILKRPIGDIYDMDMVICNMVDVKLW